MKSFAPQVVDSSGRWYGSRRFATREEAQASLSDLQTRWSIRDGDTRVVESTDPVNYRWVEGKPVLQVACPSCGMLRDRADAHSNTCLRCGTVGFDCCVAVNNCLCDRCVLGV